MASRNHLRDSGHADKVSANGAQEADLRWRLEAGAEHRSVDAFVDAATEPLCLLQGESAKSGSVGISHVGKANANAVVIGAD